jgi:tetratricopeptide (TPR) repeat protein
LDNLSRTFSATHHQTGEGQTSYWKKMTCPVKRPALLVCPAMAMQFTLQFIVRAPGEAWLTLSRADASGYAPQVWVGAHGFDPKVVAVESQALARATRRVVVRGQARDQAALVEHGRMLFDVLLPAPIKGALRGLEGHLLIAASAAIAPWALLHDGRAFLGQRWALGELGLGPDVPVAVVPGGTDRLLLVADPAADLPAARNEGELLFRALAGGGPLACDLRLGRLARRDFLRILKGYRLVHFAGHADAVAAGQGGWRFADGGLGPEALLAVAGGSAPELVFVNACSALAPDRGALVEALLRLGVRHVIGTMVDVPDLAAAAFARRFYAGLRDGQAVGEAMRRARLGDDGVWAAYRLFGDPTTPYFRRPVASTGSAGVRSGVMLAVRQPALTLTDPEAWAEAMGQRRSATRRLVEGQGGRLLPGRAAVDRAVFGLPVTYENDAERAVRAALSLVAEAPEAVVTLQAGSLVAAGLDVVGPAASAVESAVWVASRGVYALPDLAGRLRGVADFGPPEGALHPVRALLSEQERDQGLLVGRAEALARLEAMFDRGVGQAVTLLGPAGIGKSRLVEALVARLGARCAVLRGTARPYDRGAGLAAAGDVLRSLLAAEQDPPLAVEAALDALLARLGQGVAALDPDAILSIDALVAGEGLGDLSEIRPALALALGLPNARAQGPGEVPAAVARVLTAAAQERPLLVVFEDLHWMPAAGLAVIEALVEGVAGAPVLVVSTSRPGLADAPPRWFTHPSHEQLTLGPLAERDALTVLRDTLPELDLEALRQMAARAEGNPLFLRELALAHTEGGTSTPPPTVEAVIRGRFDRLPAALQEVLRAGAVLGRLFWPEGVEALLGRPTQGALVELGRRRFVSHAPSSPLPGMTAWRFNHALAHEVVYHGIGSRGRAAWHGRAAIWLSDEVPGAPDDRWARIAAHRSAAGDSARSAEAWVAAAKYASSGATPVEARAAYEAALREDALAGSALAAAVRAEAETELADLLRGAGQWEAAAAMLDAALAHTPPEAVEAHGERARRRAEIDESMGDLQAARARLADAARRVVPTSTVGLMIRRDEAWLLFRDGAYDAAVPVLDAALKDVPEAEHLLAGTVANALGVVHYSRGDYTSADRYYRRARTAFEAAGRADRLQAAYNNLGILAMRQADFEAAAGWFRRAVRLLAVAGDRDGLARAYNNLGSLFGEQGDYPRAARYLRESIQIRERAGHGGLALGYANLGEVFFKQGHQAAAGDHLTRAIDLCRAGKGPGYLLPDACRMLAELRLAEGAIDAAAALAREALELAEASGDAPRAGVAERVLGAVLAADGRADAAQAHLNSAVAALEALDQPLELAKAYAARAQHAAEPEARRADLARARALFVEVGAQVELAALQSQVAEAHGPGAAIH